MYFREVRDGKIFENVLLLQLQFFLVFSKYYIENICFILLSTSSEHCVLAQNAKLWCQISFSTRPHLRHQSVRLGPSGNLSGPLECSLQCLLLSALIYSLVFSWNLKEAVFFIRETKTSPKTPLKKTVFQKLQMKGTVWGKLPDWRKHHT